jgi:hypothetical protein
MLGSPNGPRQGKERTVSTVFAPDVGATLARRARELGRDRALSVAEGAEHLARLAKGRAGVLRLALDTLDAEDEPSDPDRNHAELLLRAALASVNV